MSRCRHFESMQAPQIVYNDLSAPTHRALPALPRVDVIVIDSRSGDGERSRTWLTQCIGSVQSSQYHNLGLVVVNNTDRKKSIGYCWNEAARHSTADLVLPLGDDDMIAFDLVGSLAGCFCAHDVAKEKLGELAMATSGYTAIDEEGRFLCHVADKHHTGMYRRRWLTLNPFDEALDRYVDTEMANRLVKMQAARGGILHTNLTHQLGYYYRQHIGQVSGQKWQRK